MRRTRPNPNPAATTSTGPGSAFDQIAIALARWDRRGRLLGSNVRFAKLFPGAEAHIAPGATLRDILTAARAVGSFTGNVDDWLRATRQQRRKLPSNRTQQVRADCWVEIHESRAADGSLVASYLDISERMRGETALRHSEQRFRNLVEGSIQGIWVHANLDPLFINDALARILGYRDASEVAALKSVLEIIAPHERDRIRGYLRARLRGEPAPQEYECDLLRKDGAYITAQVVVRRIEWDGRPAVQTTVVDITERKRAEQVLRESEQRFRDFANASADWFWEMDANLRFTYISPNMRDLIGVDPEVILGRTRRDLLSRAYAPEGWEEHLRTLESRKPFRDFIYRVENNSGKIVWASTNGIPIFDADGKFRGYRGTGSNATQRVLAQQALRESEQRFRDLVEGSIQGIVIHRDYRPLFVNEAWAQIHGYSVDEVMRMDSLLAFRPKSEHKRLLAMNRARMRGDPVPDRYSFQILHRDGTLRWLENQLRVVNWDGEPAVQSTVVDVTERTQVQDQLARSKADLECQVLELERLRQQLERRANEAVEMAAALSDAKALLSDAVESISEGFALWGADGRLMLTNDAFVRLFQPLSDIIRPGLHHMDFLRTAFSRGVYALEGNDVESEIARRIERHNASLGVYEQALSNGTWLRISTRRTKSGGVVGIATDISERKATEAMIARMALEDALTGLPNRAEFQRRLQITLNQAQRTGELVGVMLLDLDYFKNVNDTLGHQAGDALLNEVAARLQETLRKSDTVARLGGDEFAIIATNVRTPDGYVRLGERIVQAIAEPFQIEGHAVHTGTSVGITVYPIDNGDSEQLLRNADLALYRAKGDGRGTCQLYDAHMHIEVQARRVMEQDLRRALSRQEFHLLYQPQIDIASGEVIGAEALLRWEHPTRGQIQPSEFIPVAEATRLIIPLSEWLLHTACAQAKQWYDAGLPQFSLAVNMSPLHFRQENLVEQVHKALKSTGLPPHLLELEITEGMTMAGGEDTVIILNRLKAIGVQLSIDDFGTGYSSLSRLKRFPVQRLKIDRSFVRDITTDHGDAAISAAVIRLGHSLGIRVIAEGVETEEQIAFLVAQGCDELQGFFFSHPLPPDVLAAFVRKHDADAVRMLTRLDAKDATARQVQNTTTEAITNPAPEPELAVTPHRRPRATVES